MKEKERLDIVMVQLGMVESRSAAQRFIMAGQVRVNGQVVLKPSTPVRESASVSIDRGPRFVSRGGDKLEAALNSFDCPVSGRVCADVGASTGGFTDCLLQYGADIVYAIDVGEGILDWKLRQDPRVVVMEGMNARRLENLPQKVSLITMDASFISIKTLLPVVLGWVDKVDGLPRGDVLVLIKPQFEAGRSLVSKGKGVIRDPVIHAKVLREVLTFAQGVGCSIKGLIQSPLTGPKGNIEFLAWLSSPLKSMDNIEELIQPLFPTDTANKKSFI
jgi:23S rRNA (cytidine1920-2'-O)/16S rRNA (cytidine1409-2'-O)-methyltransferase